MSLGNASPVRSTLLRADSTEVSGIWTGGGAAANCTHPSTDHSAGIASVNYNGATGKYRITFTDVGAAIVPGSSLVIHSVTGVANIKLAKFVVGSLNTTTKTVDIEICDGAAPAAQDLALTDKLHICVRFARSSAP